MQRIKDFFKKIFNYPVVKSPLIAGAIVLGFILFFFAFLHFFTRHGQGFPVPDFAGLSIYEVREIAKDKKLRIEVSDSVYILTREPGSVIDQNPNPETYVKPNRRVFVTINALKPLMVEMPDIVGVTLRQAKSILELQGLSIGTLSFTPDIAVNNVLEQHFEGKTIEPGTKIPKGSKVNLLLGKGFSNRKTPLPRVIGLTASQARNVLIDASLNMGKLTFDATIANHRDSMEAKVYSQYPNPVGETSVSFGARVDLWLTLNESRIPVLEEDKKKEEKEAEKKVTYPEIEEEILE
ncbi:MAG TPA: PASTA domain-containing protein [Tenuifilaceae bacterium]|nr:PASTA domain-containing protein [Tenuifilaceae bacterium]HPE17680.1 PASTA domain-containing protein [Tenuifilaceae bacterium]HPJ45213.1 PASTA domain-containing protein [Tenuifilaceae bacterium]HPQ33442.1 PASTA domain-containing protein [Tenuifilaceae bacterium]